MIIHRGVEESGNPKVLWKFSNGIEAATAGLEGLGKANKDKLLKYIKNYVQVNSRVIKLTPKYADYFLGKHENIRPHITRHTMRWWHRLLVHV